MKTLPLFALCTLVVAGCGNPRPSPEIVAAEHYRAYAAFLDEVDELTQRFTVSSNQSSVIVGEKGSKLRIDPQVLKTTDGSPLGATIEVELKELKTTSDFLRANVPTVCDGMLLVSDGAFYLNMTSNGKPLEIMEGESISVEFPSDATEPMELFYGERNALGQFNWERANSALERRAGTASRIADGAVQDNDVSGEPFVGIYSASDTIGVEATQSPNGALTIEQAMQLNAPIYPIQLKNFGWINCDRFWDDVRPKTDILVSANQNSTLECITVYLLFKDINSMMVCQYVNGAEHIGFNEFSQVPVGEELQLIAVGYERGKLFVDVQDLTVEPNASVELAMAEVSKGKFLQVLNGVDED